MSPACGSRARQCASGGDQAAQRRQKQAAHCEAACRQRTLRRHAGSARARPVCSVSQTASLSAKACIRSSPVSTCCSGRRRVTDCCLLPQRGCWAMSAFNRPGRLRRPCRWRPISGCQETLPCHLHPALARRRPRAPQRCSAEREPLAALREAGEPASYRLQAFAAACIVLAGRYRGVQVRRAAPSTAAAVRSYRSCCATNYVLRR